MIHPTPTKVLLATTLQPLVVQLSGSLARGVRIPVIPATQSGAKLPPNPKEACHAIRTKAAPHRSSIGAQRRLS
jgi:hypothetical protein